MATVSTTLPSDGQTIDASDVNTPINAILSEFNGNIDNDNIKTGANINGAKLLASSLPGSSFDTTLAGGWISGGLPAYSSATNNGNKSYDIVFASTVASLLSPGMRLRTTRTVTAPTQCADLEASSSQYFSKTSPNKLTFTDDFTCMGWVKLESYGATMGIINRRNASTEGWSFEILSDGRVQIGALRIAGNNAFNTSYQSIPLGKWVHVAASYDLSGVSGLIYIDGVLVPSANTVTGTITALVQGTTALVVGASMSAGTSPFDGKIAQAAVFGAVLSASTIRSYMSQGLVGTETNLLSAYSCNNSLLDLNTTTPNDLTASGGALMTNADSPFGQDSNGVTAGTTDYALVMKVSTTTATVQVPEGCTIPTSGGVSAVAYSTATSPFGFTLDKGRWEVGWFGRVSMSKASPAAGTYYSGATANGEWAFSLPVGAWDFGYSINIQCVNATNVPAPQITLSTSNSAQTDADFNMRFVSTVTGASSLDGQVYRRKLTAVTSATTYYVLIQCVTASATSVSLSGANSTSIINAIPAGV